MSKRYDHDPAEHGLFRRAVELDARTLDAEARTVEAVLSTDAPVRRSFGAEVLVHTPSAVQLSRAKRGLPLLWSHDQADPIGRAEQLRVEGGQLRARLRFSKSTRGEAVFADVADGVLTDCSVGYRVHKWEDFQGGRRAVSWELLEASVVSVPADPGAEIMRTEDMSDVQTATAPAPDTRAAEIANIFTGFPTYAGLGMRCISEGKTADEARSLLLAELARASAADVDSTTSRPATAGVSAEERSCQAVAEALTVRFDAGFTRPITNPPKHLAAAVATITREYETAMQAAGENPYAGLSLVEMARAHLSVTTPEAARWGADRVVDAILKKRALVGHGISDFTELLANNIGKQLQVGYTEAPETWQQWCGVGQLPDFKTADRPVMSTFSDLDDITGDLEYEYGTFSDVKETISAKRFGKLFSITRTAILNDDRNSFTAIPRHMGRAANRMVGDEVYSRLTTNAALGQDATALFHANHSNLVASGAAPSVAQLNTMLTSFATITDPGSNVLNLRPAYVLVPWALWGTTSTLLRSSQTPGGANNDLNVWQAQLELVTEARLDANSAVAWYLAASPMSVGTVEVAFVQGRQTPFMDEQDGFTRDGRIYKVRHEFGTAVLDYRGLAKNNGT